MFNFRNHGDEPHQFLKFRLKLQIDVKYWDQNYNLL